MITREILTLPHPEIDNTVFIHLFIAEILNLLADTDMQVVFTYQAHVRIMTTVILCLMDLDIMTSIMMYQSVAHIMTTVILCLMDLDITTALYQ